MANYIASQLDATKKATSIVYSVTDPIFRKAVESGRLTGYPDFPNLSQAFKVASILQADYVLTYDAAAVKSRTSKARAELYQAGRRVWKDELNFGVQDPNGSDERDTAQSLARTWATHLAEGPFKYVKVDVKVPTPAPMDGQSPKTVVDPSPVAPIEKKPVDNASLKSRVDKMVADGEVLKAVALLRDSIDASPLDAERRLMLVQTLLDANLSSQAGDEADRALKLFPDNEDLRQLAAKAWIAAGKSDAAKSDVNEAIARNQGGGKMKVLLAELALAHSDPKIALENLDQSVKEQPTAEALYLRALCRSIMGGLDGAKIDMDALAKQKPPIDPAAFPQIYELGANYFDGNFKTLGSEAREVMQDALVKPDDTGLHDRVTEMLRLLASQTSFMATAPVPAAYQPSHDRRLLAYKLMVETLNGVQSFFSGGGQDALTEARIDLGEALKQAELAHEAYAEAQKQLTPIDPAKTGSA